MRPVFQHGAMLMHSLRGGGDVHIDEEIPSPIGMVEVWCSGGRPSSFGGRLQQPGSRLVVYQGLDRLFNPAAIFSSQLGPVQDYLGKVVVLAVEIRG